LSIKESSDEFNPKTSAADVIDANGRSYRTGTDYLALALATCGVGYLPLAPGTWGSIVGVGVFLLLRFLVQESYRRLGAGHDLILLNPQLGFLALELVVILGVTLLGIWAASQTERMIGRKDPGKVVIDEVAGQMIALLPVPLFFVRPWAMWVIISFTLFRFFDIVKPYPARRLESLHGGLGIMADDVIAGAYAAVVTAVLIAGFAMFVF
jgi:phosphatidylglycerophosphatase A